MQGPAMFTPRSAAPDTTILSAALPVPGLGILPANAFVIHSKEPVLVDAGVVAMKDAFVHQLGSAIDVEDLRWLWLTHVDADHVGAVFWLLESAPRLRIVTTYLGMGKLGLLGPVAPDRVHLLNPGQSLDVGDRRLLAVRPPTFDAPETTGLFDTKTGALFSSDCFGGLLQAPEESAASLSAEELTEGIVRWTTVDAPWLHGTDPSALDHSIRELASLNPSVVLSSHLPPAPRLFDPLVRALVAARNAAPFVGPDQAALERMLRAA